MPGTTDGFEVAERFKAKYPEGAVILPYFANRSPLAVMLQNGSGGGLQRVREYLDDACTGMD